MDFYSSFLKPSVTIIPSLFCLWIPHLISRLLQVFFIRPACIGVKFGWIPIVVYPFIWILTSFSMVPIPFSISSLFLLSFTFIYKCGMQLLSFSSRLKNFQLALFLVLRVVSLVFLCSFLFVLGIILRPSQRGGKRLRGICCQCTGSNIMISMISL